MPQQADVRRAVAQAVTLSRAGESAQAEQLCRQVLAVQPEQPTALLVLGVCLLQRGEYADAEQTLAACLRLQPQEPAALANRGIALHGLRRFHEALACYAQALALAAQQPATLNMQGLALIELKQFDEALTSLDQAVAAAPRFAEAWCSRATALIHLGEFEQALDSLDRAEALRSDYGEALSNRAIVLNLLRQHQQALLAAQRALKLLPGHSVVYRNLGDSLTGLHRHDEALTAYGKAVELDPHNHHLYVSRAQLLTVVGRHEEAAESYRRALSCLDQSEQEFLPRLGNVNDSMDENVRWQLALISHDRGQVLAEAGRPLEAVEAFGRATSWRADFADAHWAESMERLRLGDYAEGWRKYEWRRRKPDFKNTLRRFAQPEWSGDTDPAGLRILLHAEQGFGDLLQFCRYAPLLAQRRARVILAAQPSLRAVLGSLPGIEVIADGEALPQFDIHCPVMSLPFAFRTTVETIPAQVPYLRADPSRAQHWANVLGPRRRPRVGLVWSGNPRQSNDKARSLPLAKLSPLFGLQAEFISLNKEIREADRSDFARSGLLPLGEQLTDFADTAALVENLDLVIAVDTAVAHLAGAMGKPLWILLAKNADYRWLLEREDSPWYPTARLFRQSTRGEWTAVIERVTHELAVKLVSSTNATERTNAGDRRNEVA